MKGDNKIQFEKWYINDYIRRKENIGLHVFGTKVFDKTPIEYKIGVYLAYYDSLGYHIGTTNEHGWEFDIEWIVDFKLKFITGKNFNTRNEAYKEAFKKADEIVNKQLNKHESNN